MNVIICNKNRQNDIYRIIIIEKARKMYDNTYVCQKVKNWLKDEEKKEKEEKKEEEMEKIFQL